MKSSSERRKIDGEWVKALREELGVSQEGLAERLGISRSAVARWEIKAFRPSKLAAMALLGLAATHREGQESQVQAQDSKSVEFMVRKTKHSHQQRSHHVTVKRNPRPRSS